MAYTTNLYRTLSREYSATRMNPSEYVATAKVLGASRIEPADDFDVGDTVFFRVVANSKDRTRDLTVAVRDTFSQGGCDHDYDCCGCGTSYADVQRVGARVYRVKLSTYYNY